MELGKQGGIGTLASNAQGQSGAGVYSIGTSIIVAFLALAVLVVIYKNFNKITDFIFKRKTGR
jgi:hypothetical protein